MSGHPFSIRFGYKNIAPSDSNQVLVFILKKTIFNLKSLSTGYFPFLARSLKSLIQNFKTINYETRCKKRTRHSIDVNRFH